jgi:hypothetical protein
VDGSNQRSVRPFGKQLALWRDVPGAVTADGRTVTEPAELKNAKFLLGILQRFGGYTLKTLLEEDAGLIQLLQIEAMAGKEDASAERG